MIPFVIALVLWQVEAEARYAHNISKNLERANRE